MNAAHMSTERSGADADKLLARISAARRDLIVVYPFWGSLALQLRVELDASGATPTASVDGTTMRFGPAYIGRMPQSQLVGLIAHEAAHCAFAHHARKGHREHERYNVACDYAIDPLLVDSGLDVPDPLINREWAGLSAEQIYPLLPEIPPSGCRPGVVLQAPADTRAEQEVLWSVALQSAATVARAAGRLPAGVDRLIEAGRARVDWRDQARLFATQISREDYSWRHLSRRHMARGIYLPGLRDEACPPLVVALDTSGSVSGPSLGQFAAELATLHDELRPEATHVLHCDAEVAHVQVFERGLPINPRDLQPKGGGGTDFRPVFEYIGRELDGEVAGLIYLTDAEGTFPPVAPEYPVLWVIEGEAGAPWGSVARL